MLDFNETIKALYKESSRLLEEDKLDDSMAVLSILFKYEMHPDPSAELIIMLNKLLTTVKDK